MPHRPKHVLEYAALRAIGAIASALPHRAALTLGWLLAALGYPFAHRRVREAHRRIRIVFGNRYSRREVRRIAWRSLRNFVFNGIEMLRIHRITPAWLNRNTNCSPAAAPLRTHAATGRGAIIAIPHMGNWETAAVAAIHAGIPVFSIAARQKNPLVDAHINRLRRAPGTVILPRGSGTMRNAIRRLREGGFLAILPDVRIADGGLPTPFLGATAHIGPGMALFARHANVPIFPCGIARVGWTRQHMFATDPIWPDLQLDKDTDARRMTELVLARVDAWIRESPDQWFWFNKRWILDPPPQKPAPPET